jgi:hypothetical protein
MSIENVLSKAEMGASGAEATFVTHISFSGDATYPDGGSDADAALAAGIGKNVTAIAIIPVKTNAGTTKTYEPRIVQTPASVKTAVETWPVADQDTKTITYKVDGGDEQTLTLSGAHTSAAHLAASFTAETGVHAYEDAAGQVIVKSELRGEASGIEITGGTANAIYLFPTVANVGSAAPKLMIVDAATGLDVGLDAASTDLSSYTWDAVLLSE